MSDFVSYTGQGDVAVIRMDDSRANALSFKMLEELGEARKRAQAEGKAILLTGRPGTFCAGLDLKVMLSGMENVRKLLSAAINIFADFMLHPRPLVIASTGHALAGGAFILLSGDLRLSASGDYRIGLNEVAIGMQMPRAAALLARERIPENYYLRSVLLAELYSPAQAVPAGFVDLVCPEGELFETALGHASRLAALDAYAYAATKLSVRGETAQAARKALEEELLTLKGPGGRA